MRTRHNNIVKRLTKALPNDAGDVYTEQVIPEDTRGLKPDLVILNSTTKTATVVDVTIPFDTEQAMAAAKKEKETKYAYLKQILEEKGFTKVTIGAFVVGSLGSWDPANEGIIKSLRIKHTYIKLFRLLCCSNTIEDSQAIWRARS